MHAGVRNATALLQQEVGQAGRITLPAAVTLTATARRRRQHGDRQLDRRMFVGEYLVIGTGENQETVAVTALTGTGDHHRRRRSTKPHAADAPVVGARAGSAAGVVPPRWPTAPPARC